MSAERFSLVRLAARSVARSSFSSITTWMVCMCGLYSTVYSTVVSGVGYGVADQLTQITYDGRTETRTYNSRLQLTRLTVPGSMDLEYWYSTTANNGQITQQKDWLSGEEVNYTYDSLARLIQAATTNATWGVCIRL